VQNTKEVVKKILPLKYKIFIPVSIIILIVIVFVTLWSVNKSINSFNEQIKSSLTLEVETISKMFERENILKKERVRSNIRVAKALFLHSDFIFSDEIYEKDVINQQTGEKQVVLLKKWLYNNGDLWENTVFVDSLTSLFLGGTATVFQRIDSGFVRISTNVYEQAGNRAVGTYIPNNSTVAKKVLSGEDFIGRAYVVNDWYITAYTPIYNSNDLVGMLYVGGKEKDLPELKAILNNLVVGKSGYPFVFDKNGSLIIHPYREGQFWGDSLLFQDISNKESGIITYKLDIMTKIMAFKYFDDFELFIGAAVYKEIEIADLKRDAIIGTLITAIIATVFLLAFLYYFTTERLNNFFVELYKSKKRIISISQALEESEERFERLFNSTGDDIFVTDINENIVEVNASACETLMYSKNELLRMKITDIKSPSYVNKVSDNRRNIYDRGSYRFESEHVAKDGTIIQVEFFSRLVSYNKEKLILSVVRNINKRKELERQILSAVIRAEEKERHRFAKDMHDGLGPLLSTIKLYVNELNSDNLTSIERNELIKHSNELIDEAVNSTRTISNNLMPSVIHSYGLIQAVKAFCNKINITNKLNIIFEDEGIEERLDQNIELILFRVISELINNTLKHAQATKVLILITKDKNKISLFFKDDGIGFNVDDIINSEQKGMGLKNIISRIKSINGTYNFYSSINNGFSISIEIII